MNELPAGTAYLITPVVGNAVTGAHDAAEFLNIEVEQFTGELALVAHDRGAGSSALSRERPWRRSKRETVARESALCRAIWKPGSHKRRKARTTATWTAGA